MKKNIFKITIRTTIMFIIVVFLWIEIKAISLPWNIPQWWTWNIMKYVINMTNKDCWEWRYVQWLNPDWTLKCKMVSWFRWLTLWNTISYVTSWSWIYSKYLENIEKDCWSGRYMKWFDTVTKKMICVDKSNIETKIWKTVIVDNASIWYPSTPSSEPITWNMTPIFEKIVNSICPDNNSIRWFYSDWSKICEPMPVDWVCWSSNGINTYMKPTTNLCSVWTASLVWTTATTYTWSCDGYNSWDTVNCSANKSIDCVWWWSDTSTCNVTCWWWVKQQLYIITTVSQNWWIACSYTNWATRWGSTACNTQLCTQVVSCGWTIVSNATSNASATTYTQTLYGTTRSPYYAWTRNATSWLCTYNCNINYTWNGSACIANTQVVSCGWSIAWNATATTSTTYTQTWNWSSWFPTYFWNISQSTCGYNCNLNYTWNGSSCIANTKSATCWWSIVWNATATTSSTYTQIWNWSSWFPTYFWNISQSTCDYNCNIWYIWNGSSCVVATCILPWWWTIANWASVTAYSTTSVACGNSCSSYSQTRTCTTNWVLSWTNTYTNQSCSVAACPVNCSYWYSQWWCSSTCWWWSYYRYLNITKYPSWWWTACPGSQGQYMWAWWSCNTQPCCNMTYTCYWTYAGIRWCVYPWDFYYWIWSGCDCHRSCN